MLDHKRYKTCLYCGKRFEVNGKSEFEKRKYCSLQCSYDKRHQEWLDRKIIICDGWKKQNNEINITNRELEEYRQTQTVCEICGMPERSKCRNQYGLSKETMNLTIDHDHKTGEFRGLLCRRCNRCLGWFDKYKDSIITYCS